MIYRAFRWVETSEAAAEEDVAVYRYTMSKQSDTTGPQVEDSDADETDEVSVYRYTMSNRSDTGLAHHFVGEVHVGIQRCLELAPRPRPDIKRSSPVSNGALRYLSANSAMITAVGGGE